MRIFLFGKTQITTCLIIPMKREHIDSFPLFIPKFLLFLPKFSTFMKILGFSKQFSPMIRTSFILLTLVLASCHTSKKTADKPEGSMKTEVVTIQSKSEYQQGDPVNFMVQNNHPEMTLKLYHPLELTIEKKSENDWEQVKILYCPCGASCPPPPEYREVKPKQAYQLAWDQKTSWCGEMQDNGIKKYHEKLVTPGEYRLVLQYQFENELKTIYKRFKIIN